jgi:hypothetical protein
VYGDGRGRHVLARFELGKRLARPGIRCIIGISERGEHFAGNVRAALGETGGEPTAGRPLGELSRSDVPYLRGSLAPELRVCLAHLWDRGDRDDPFQEARFQRERETDRAAQGHTGIPDRTVGSDLGRAGPHCSGEILDPKPAGCGTASAVAWKVPSEHLDILEPLCALLPQCGDRSAERRSEEQQPLACFVAGESRERELDRCAVSGHATAPW